MTHTTTSTTALDIVARLRALSDAQPEHNEVCCTTADGADEIEILRSAQSALIARGGRTDPSIDSLIEDSTRLAKRLRGDGVIVTFTLTTTPVKPADLEEYEIRLDSAEDALRRCAHYLANVSAGGKAGFNAACHAVEQHFREVSLRVIADARPEPTR